MKEKANDYFAVKQLMEDVYGLCDCTPPSFLITGKEKTFLLDRKYGTAGLNQAARYMISFPMKDLPATLHPDTEHICVQKLNE